MNGDAALGLVRPPLGNPELIAALERLLVEARAGRVIAAAIVTSGGPGKMDAMAVGGFQAELFMGCAAIQGGLLASVQGRPSPILRPA